MSEDLRVDGLFKAIGDLDDVHLKDVLTDDLQYAKDINGTEDPTLKGIKHILISNVRAQLLSHKRIKDAIIHHEERCASHHQSQDSVSFGKGGLKVTGKYAGMVAIAIVVFGFLFLYQHNLNKSIANNISESVKSEIEKVITGDLNE